MATLTVAGGALGAPADMSGAHVATVDGQPMWVQSLAATATQVAVAADGSERLIYPGGVSLKTTDGSRVDQIIHRRAADGAFDDYLVSLKQGPAGAREQARRRLKGSHSGNGTIIGSLELTRSR